MSGRHTDPWAEGEPTCNGLTATRVGTALNDVINGTSGRDVIVGLGGADTINGSGGDDWIDGGASPDGLKASVHSADNSLGARLVEGPWKSDPLSLTLSLCRQHTLRPSNRARPTGRGRAREN
jgi:hypothetical protein